MLSRSLFPSSRNRIDDQRSRARQTRPHADCHDDALASTLPSTHSACRPRDGAHFSSHRGVDGKPNVLTARLTPRSEEHTSELQSRLHIVCRLLLEKKKSS